MESCELVELAGIPWRGVSRRAASGEAEATNISWLLPQPDIRGKLSGCRHRLTKRAVTEPLQ